MVSSRNFCLSLTAILALAACSQPQEPESPFPDEEEGGAQVFDATPEEEDFPAAYIYQCGQERVAIEFIDAEQMMMYVGEDEVTMFRVVSASGARFQAANDPDTVFWLQADGALLTLAGDEQPACTMTREPVATAEASSADRASPLTGREWVVEDINSAGLIDSSRVTLNFSADGRLAGLASCNNYTTSYAVNGSAVTTSAAAVTRKMCPEALMTQENAFLDALEAATRFEFDETGALVLSGEGTSITARR